MLIGKVKHLEANAEGMEQNFSSVRSNYIDGEIFNSALKDTTTMQGTIDERNKEQPFFKKLSEDIFHTLYKPEPHVYDKANVIESLYMENDLLNELINNDKIERLRGNTAGDLFYSTLSLNNFQDKAYGIIQEWVEKNKKNKEAMDAMNNTIEYQDALKEMLEELSDDPGNQTIQDQIDQLQNQVDQGNQAVQEAMGGTSPTASINSKLQKAMDDTAKATNGMAQMFNDFFGGGNDAQNGGGAGSGKGTLQQVPFAERVRLAEALQGNSTLKEIAKKLGRMKKMLGDINKKPSKYGNSISDVGTGNNISRILSSEKLELLDPDLEYHFYKKFLNKSLLEYKTQGEEEMKGPIIVCLDDSGSMSGNRDYWAKSIALCMLQLAMAGKRSFRCIIFSDGVDKVYDFNKDDYSTDRMLEMAQFFASGGTEYVGALQEALKSIGQSRFRKADILFVTDGRPDHLLKEKFKNKFKLAKDEKEFSVHGILIGGTEKKYLKEFCDDITTFGDLNKDDELVNIFKTVKQK